MALEAIEDYYDLNDIIATNEKIPCKVEMPIYRLGKVYVAEITAYHMFSREY